MHFFYNTNKILFILIFTISYWFNSIVNANIYIVDNFKFSEKISNIKKNRSNIIDKIKIQAFEELKKRLLVEDDLKLIKSNEEGLNLIDNFIIKDEIQINKDYQFVVSVKFNPNKVKNFFKSQNIRFVDYKGDPLLIFYFEKEKSGKMNVWNNDSFYEIFFSYQDFLIEYVSPGGDLKDQNSVIFEENVSMKDIKVNKLLNNYGLKNYLVIFYDKNYPNNIRTKFSINKTVYYKSFLFDGNFKSIIPKLKFFVENIWKEQNIFNIENTTLITYNFYPKDIISLNTFKKIISKNKNISKQNIQFISKKKITGSFIFSGSEDDLTENLENQKVKINKKNKIWDIYLNE
tara:strand:+ start:35045 stop:36082 length:1038 start_codon:yes stop_codon:yes gene_type:complete